jgi:GNAT superfamily N-acetyltransferase
VTTTTAPAALSHGIRRQGGIITGILAFPWAATGAGPLGAGTAYWAVIAASGLLSIAAVAVALGSAGKTHTAERELPPRWRRSYHLIVLAELVLIGLVAFGLVALQQSDAVPAAVCLIVGLHFLPLAKVFAQPQYRGTGYAMTVAAVVSLVVLFAAGAVASMVVAGFGAALSLWATSFHVSRVGP